MPRKKKAKPEPPPPPPEPPIDPRFWLPEHLKEWVQLRSKAKEVYRPKPKKRKLTRFQRKGPADMKKFKKWYKMQMKKLQQVYEKTLQLADNIKREKNKRRRLRRPRIEYLDWERLEEMALPLWYTPKYIAPLEEDFPYAPQVNPKIPAKKGKARPFIQKQIPCCFMHDILEMDFWFEYRFVIRKSAMVYKATAYIKKLAEPKKVPQDPPHCPIPPSTDYSSPREKMNPSRWLRHIRYLKFFALPKHKMYPRKLEKAPYRGPKACIDSLEDSIDRLSQPRRPRKICRRMTPEIEYLTERAKRAREHNISQRLEERRQQIPYCPEEEDLFAVKERAKKGSASDRTQSLAKPRRPIKLCTYEDEVQPKPKDQEGEVCPKVRKRICRPKRDPFAVKRRALRGEASERTKELAKPKRPIKVCKKMKKCRPVFDKAACIRGDKPCYMRTSIPCPEKPPKKSKKKRRKRSKFSYTCKEREIFLCPTTDPPTV